jgi:hypothetical protein
MSDPETEPIRGAHAQALRSTLLEVLEFVEHATKLTALDAGGAGERALPPERSAAITERLEALETMARGLMTRFELPERAPNVRGEIRAYSSRAWADLIDSQSRAMRRYGAPPEWYGRELDPILERMAGLAHEILYYSREPER